MAVSHAVHSQIGQLLTLPKSQGLTKEMNCLNILWNLTWSNLFGLLLVLARGLNFVRHFPKLVTELC